MATHPKTAQEKVHGPSWIDVTVIWLELEALVGRPVELVQFVGKTAAGTRTFMLRVRLGGREVMMYGQSFTPGGKDGPVTMPAAQYQALTKVYHWFEGLSVADRGDWLNDELPF